MCIQVIPPLSYPEPASDLDLSLRQDWRERHRLRYRRCRPSRKGMAEKQKNREEDKRACCKTQKRKAGRAGQEARAQQSKDWAG